MLWEVLRILNELNYEQLPLILLMENVSAIENKNNIEEFLRLQRKLNKLGYRNFIEQLNLKDFGIPQSRLRCFMVSIKGNYYYSFPHPIKLKYYLKDFLQQLKHIPVKYFLTQKRINCYIDRKPHGLYVRFIRFRPFYFDGKDVAFTLLTGQNNHVTDMYVYYPKEKYIEEKTGTLKINNQDVVVRGLTPYECCIIMGFEPKDYNKIQDKVSDVQIIKQCGNSIGITVLIAIISRFYNDIDYEYVINEYVDRIIRIKKEQNS